MILPPRRIDVMTRLNAPLQRGHVKVHTVSFPVSVMISLYNVCNLKVVVAFA